MEQAAEAVGCGSCSVEAPHGMLQSCQPGLQFWSNFGAEMVYKKAVGQA